MCGILAIYLKSKFDPGQLHIDLDHLIGTLKHRGPDGTGVFRDSRILLGHQRLAILDLSEVAGQPMTSGDGRFVIVYNGEVYNYVELRDELQGVDLRTTSDTEVIVELFARQGPSILEKLNGMFAFAVWDKELERLYVARDRFGI
ncbi:MAG: asparagine synthetase B, partial [Candidatus Thorarchaeota archaeon]